MKFITDNKAPGFRLTLIGIVLALLTLVEYTCVYASTRYMSWEAFWILAAGIVLCVILIAAKQYRFVPTALLASVFIAFLYYLYHIYFFISSVAVGIQFSGFPFSFYLNIACFVITLIVAIVCVFLPQTENK